MPFPLIPIIVWGGGAALIGGLFFGAKEGAKETTGEAGKVLLYGGAAVAALMVYQKSR